MKIAITAAGLALAGGLGAAVPAEAQHYGHQGNGGYHDGYRGGGFHGGGYHGGYRGGSGPRYGHGYGYHPGRLVCRYRHGFRRCFRAY